MHGTYSQNKKSIYNYKQKNIDKVNAIARKANKKRYEWLKIKKVFLNILLS
jgi:hypothetical protein